jgi:hypothetical protein
MKIPVYAHVATVSCFIPAIAGIYQWKKLESSFKVLTVFFCYTAIHASIEEILRRMGINNLFLGNYHQVVEIECFLFFFSKWTENKKLIISIQYIGIGYLLFWVVNKFYFENATEFNEIIATLSNFILIVFSTLILFELVRKVTIPLFKHAVFWISASVMLYCAGTIIIFSFTNTLLQMGGSYFTILWYVNWTLTIISNLMFARSFWCKMS